MKSLDLLARRRRVRVLALIAALSSLALAAPVTAVPPAHSASSVTGSPADSAGFERVSRIGFDLLILRPLNLVTTTLSLAGAVVAYPVALPFGGQGHVVDYLIKDPIDRTFRQPLGAL